MQAYGPSFAKIYNLRWNPFSDTVFPRFQEYFEGRLPKKRTLLDLCCGTGRLSSLFLNAGWTVTGVDLSPDMLEHARVNNREHIENGSAQFFQANARDFALRKPVEFAISTYDALNHLESDEDLLSCFCCVHRSLKEGGTFLFDLNTPYGLQNWNNVSISDRDGFFLIHRGFYDESKHRATTKIEGFLKLESGLYERFGEIVSNTAFRNDKVGEMLREAGFRNVIFSRLQSLGTPCEDPDHEIRIFIIAEK
jgi:SAM-dependent methyltransferase